MDGPRSGSVLYDCELLAHATRTATRKAVVMLGVVVREANRHVSQTNRLARAPSTFAAALVPPAFVKARGLHLARRVAYRGLCE